MMQSADPGDGDDLAFIDGLRLAELRSVLTEREVGSGAVIVLEVPPEDAPQVLLTEDDDVVEAFSSKGPNHALTVGILPRRPGRGQDLLDSHGAHATNEGRAIDLVSVAGRGCGGTSAGSATAALSDGGCTATRWLRRPRSQAYATRRECEALPKLGSHGPFDG